MPFFFMLSSGQSELEYHLLLGKDLGHIKPKDYQELS
jgi:hypothetical protein